MSQEFLMSPEISVAICKIKVNQEFDLLKIFCEKDFSFQMEHHEFFKQETELVRRQGIDSWGNVNCLTSRELDQFQITSNPNPRPNNDTPLGWANRRNIE